MLQRRRECFNGHRYTTYEISDRLAKTLTKWAAPSATAVQKAEKLWKRDQTIVRAVRNGATMREVADAHGLAANTVSWVVKRLAPELTRKGRASSAP